MPYGHELGAYCKRDLFRRLSAMVDANGSIDPRQLLPSDACLFQVPEDLQYLGSRSRSCQCIDCPVCAPAALSGRARR